MRSVFSTRVALATTLVFLAAAPAFADTWPQRTVRVIVPNPAGVNLDIMARLFATQLSARWGQPVIVENLPGPDGILAAREFVTRRDNHTLMYSFPALLSINPLTIEKLPYDPARDLIPIASTSDNFIAIAVPASSKANSLAEFVQLAKAQPKKLNWAGTPGIPYFAFVALQKTAGLDMVQTPYRDFNHAIVDLGEGRIDAVAAGAGALLPQARAGKIRLLAVVNATRAPVAPDVPTVAEQGFPDLTFSGVTGFFGGRDMPDALRDRIAADIRSVATEPAIRDRIAAMGSIAKGSTPSEFKGDIQKQREQIGGLVRALKGS